MCCIQYSLISGVSASCNSTQNFCSEVKAIQLNKATIFTKLSRYSYEKKKHRHLSEKELEIHLKKRGTDFEKLVHHYDLHKKFEDMVATTLTNMGVNIEVVNRSVLNRILSPFKPKHYLSIRKLIQIFLVRFPQIIH